MLKLRHTTNETPGKNSKVKVNCVPPVLGLCFSVLISMIIARIVFHCLK